MWCYCWHSCGCITPILWLHPSMVTLPLPLCLCLLFFVLEGRLSLKVSIRAYLDNPGWFLLKIFNLIISAKTLFPNWFWVLGCEHTFQGHHSTHIPINTYSYPPHFTGVHWVSGESGTGQTCDQGLCLSITWHGDAMLISSTLICRWSVMMRHCL